MSDEFHFAQIGDCNNGLSLVLSYSYWYAILYVSGSTPLTCLLDRVHVGFSFMTTAHFLPAVAGLADLVQVINLLYHTCLHFQNMCCLVTPFCFYAVSASVTSQNGILTFYTTCTDLHLLDVQSHRSCSGTLQCLATAMPAISAATLTATARAATAALTALAVVTEAATVNSAGWQCVYHSAVRGLRFGAFFGLK